MHDPPVLAPGQQPGALENRKVLHEPGERHRGTPGELADGRRAIGEAIENRAAGRVRERREHVVESCRAGGSRLIVNHTV